MTNTPITFDRLIRVITVALVFAAAIALIGYLSSVLLPFFVAFGIASRIARTAAEELRREGVKAGCFRPVSLNPFPCKQLAAAAKGRRIVAIELDAGQFADDVRLNLAKAGLGAEAASVKMVHRMGGQVVSVDDAVSAAKSA